MTVQLHRRTGFEIELMAPPGLSRRTLARDLAARHGGQVLPVWHHDSEPSLVPGLGRFLHLTQGFEVRKPDGTTAYRRTLREARTIATALLLPEGEARP